MKCKVQAKNYVYKRAVFYCGRFPSINNRDASLELEQLYHCPFQWYNSQILVNESTVLMIYPS